MTIEVEAPDGSIVEFPDETPRDIMTRAMQSRFGAQPSQSPALPPNAQEFATFDSQTGPAPAQPSDAFFRGVSGHVTDTLKPIGKYADAVTTGINRLASTTAPVAPQLAGASEILSGSPVAEEAAKGVPVAGGFVPQTEAMTQLEQQHPTTAALANLTGGIGSMALGAPLLAGEMPAWLANAPRLGKFGLETLGYGGLAATDTATRDALAPKTGQDTGNPAGLMNWAGFNSTGSRPLDAAITGGALSVPVKAAGGLVSYLGPETSPAAEALRRQKVSLSPGQRVGGNLAEAEEIGSAIPFTGMSRIAEKGMPTFNRGAENMALEPLNIPEFRGTGIETKVPGTGSSSQPGDVTAGFDGRAFVHKQATNAYDYALSGRPWRTNAETDRIPVSSDECQV